MSAKIETRVYVEYSAHARARPSYAVSVPESIAAGVDHISCRRNLSLDNFKDLNCAEVTLDALLYVHLSPFEHRIRPISGPIRKSNIFSVSAVYVISSNGRYLGEELYM